MSMITGYAPAFPGPRDDTNTETNQGMSLRDWFAGQALEGLIMISGTQKFPAIAASAYAMADAMLEARRGEPSDDI